MSKPKPIKQHPKKGSGPLADDERLARFAALAAGTARRTTKGSRGSAGRDLAEQGRIERLAKRTARVTDGAKG
jgi:hypothetical protein